MTFNALLLAGVIVIAIIFAFSSTGDHWYSLFKWIHVTFAVIWIGGGAFITILAARAQQSGDTGEVLTIARQAAFAGERIFAPAGLIVFLMGIAMMLNTDWGWGTFWIDAGLVGYAATFITRGRRALTAGEEDRERRRRERAGPSRTRSH